MRNWMFALVFLFGFIGQSALAGNLPLGSNPSPQKYSEVYADDTEAPAVAASSRSESSSSLSADYSEPSNIYKHVSLTPMAGATMWSGRWGQQIYNNFAFALALEIPLATIFSMELEGGIQQMRINYAAPLPMFGWQNLHTITQYSFGTNGKLYIVRHKIFNPYVGAGIAALLYDGLRSGTWPQVMNPYSSWIGAGQLMAGMDVNVVDHVALGFRGAYVIPLFNLAPSVYNQYQSSPATADNSAIDSSYFKLMANLKITF